VPHERKIEVPLAFLLIVFVASKLLAQADTADSREDFVSRDEETWQSHDAEHLADFFSEDADRISVFHK